MYRHIITYFRNCKWHQISTIYVHVTIQNNTKYGLTGLQSSRWNSCCGVHLSSTGIRISAGTPPTSSKAGKEKGTYLLTMGNILLLNLNKKSNFIIHTTICNPLQQKVPFDPSCMLLKWYKTIQRSNHLKSSGSRMQSFC